MTWNQLSKKVTTMVSIVLAPVLLLGLCAIAIAEDSVKENEEEKALRVGSSQKQLKVKLQSAKSYFKVGEPIAFHVKGNQEFFLYLFSVNDHDDRGMLILPNELDTGNKYPGGQRFKVPTNKGVEFTADKPGTERIIMVASTKYLSFNTESYQRMGKFKVASAKSVDNQIKGLRVRAGSSSNPGIVVQEINIDIKSRNDFQAPRTGHHGDAEIAMVFVNADRTEYKEGETVRVIYGADTPGWVSIFVEQPNGGRSLLKTQQVSGKSFYHLRAVAERPAGMHALVARHTMENPGEKNAAEIGRKGLHIVDDEPKKFVETTFRFRIR